MTKIKYTSRKFNDLQDAKDFQNKYGVEVVS
jgi:hypothetical protein